MVDERTETGQTDRRPGGSQDERFLLSLAVLFLLALGVRLVDVWQFRRSPFFGVLLGDSERYDAWARSISTGDWLGSGVFFQAPLYPYFLALVHRLLVDDPVTIMLIQIVLGATTCVLLALAAREFFDSKSALCAGALLALYPTALFFNHIQQKATLALLLLCAMLYLLARALTRGAGAWVAAGLVAGALSLTRENSLILVACVTVWLLLDRARRPSSVQVLRAAAFLGGTAIVLLPVGARNWLVGGEFVLTSSQAGVNLWIGNNPAADGSYRPLVPGHGSIRFEAADAQLVAARELGYPVSARDASRYWARRAMGWIRDEPSAWARLMLRKLHLLLQRVERMDTEDQYSHRDATPLARWLGYGLHFGILLPLAVLGALLTWTDPASQRRRLLALLALAYAASVWLFFVLDRYRFPLLPMLAMFAGAAIAHADRLRRIPPSKAIVMLLSVAAAATIANVGDPSIDRMRAQSYANLAVHLGEGGRTDEAIRQLRHSLSYAPRVASARYNLGLYLARDGQIDAAEAELRRATELDPGHRKAAAELARVLARLGRLAEAATAYERALELDSENATLFDRLGVVEAQRGRLAAAETAFARALELDPTRESAIRNLERARAERAAAGSGDEAPPIDGPRP